jgi:matrixin
MRTFLFPLVAGLAVFAAAGPASAFCRSTTCSGECNRNADNCKQDGAPLYWASTCVGFSLQEDGSEFVDFPEFERVAEESFVTWSDVLCESGGVASMAFERLQNAECHQAEYNPDGPNANVIMFQDTKWEYTSPDNTLAKTTVTYDKDTGEILDADIELNHAYNEFTTGDDYVVYDLQSILTHEIGHFLGLDHTLDFLATMNAGYQEGSTELRSLESDDTAGLCTVYPEGRAGQCVTKPKNGFASQCQQVLGEDDDGCSIAVKRDDDERRGHAGAGAVLAALGIFAAARRRRDKQEKGR